MCPSLLGASLNSSFPDRALTKIARIFVCKCLGVCFKLHLTIRRPALGWPLAISQGEHLSYCVGSPVTLGGLKVSLCADYLSKSSSIFSYQLVGESLSEMVRLTSRCLNRSNLLVFLVDGDM